MSDKELEALKQKRMMLQEHKKEPRQRVDASQILNKLFIGRAWEVFNAAKTQFPGAIPEIERLLVRLAIEGKIGKMEGEQLLGLFREIGLPVKLNTTIKIINHGKTKALSEQFKDAMK